MIKQIISLLEQFEKAYGDLKVVVQTDNGSIVPLRSIDIIQTDDGSFFVGFMMHSGHSPSDIKNQAVKPNSNIIH